MIDFDLKLDRRFKRKMLARYDGHVFEAGILKDKPHYQAKTGKGNLTTVYGGPARKTSRTRSKETVSQVSKNVTRETGINIYQAPLQGKGKNREIKAFLDAMFKYFADNRKTRDVAEALRNIIIQPILRNEYGSNSRVTQMRKGFNRRFIDTGQLVKNIMGRISRKKSK